MDALQSVVTSIEKFSPKLYKALLEIENNNLICSPTSLSIVLSMITFGAKGKTEEELKSGLCLPENDAVTKNGIRSLIDILNNVKSSELRLANKIYTAIGFEIKPQFQVVMKTSFLSTTESINFENVEESCKKINMWCSEQTNNRIVDIIKPIDITNAELVLVNAIYFKGTWAEVFDASNTRLRPFYINEQITKDVPTMHKKDYYNYDKIPNLDAHYIELPYKSDSPTDAISMFIILPDAMNGLKDIEEHLDKINYQELHQRRNLVRIHLQLPKFTITSLLNLNAVLEKMGMRSMFRSADFSGISNVPLHVSQVLQKAFLEVNEKGSEAAAVSVVMMARCAMPRPPIDVAVNRPFFCAIVATHAGTQLFNARVVDPIAPATS